MGIEEMKTMKTQLMGCIQGQMGNLKDADTKQLGQAIDMIKDLSQAIYYCTITQAMEKTESQPINNINYYTTTPPYGKIYPDTYRDWERTNGYMYYPGGSYSSNSGGNNAMGGGTRGYIEPMYYYNGNEMVGNSMMMRDPREGKAAIRRRMYMEGKEMHKDTNSQLRELEAYLQELSSDITEMIKDASPQERATLHQKMTTLASKIG